MNKPLLKSLTQSDLRSISHRFKKELIALYGDQLDGLILYGSYARGDHRLASDVDFLVVLKQDSVQFGQEVDRISTISSELGLDYTIHVSAKPVSASDYKSSNRLFYQAIRSEGIAI